MNIAKFEEKDTANIASIWNSVIDEGESFFWKHHFTIEEISKILQKQDAVFCMKDEEEVIGFYILHANFPDRGNHIANALYAVRKDCRSKGFGKILGEHSLKTAKEYKYKAMQFNSVVSSNLASICLWERLGFHRIGKVEAAFTTNNNELIDIYIYYKVL